MKSKFTDWITVFLIQLVLTIPFYTTNVYGLTISNVKVAKVTASSAVIEWSTDVLANGKVKYGQTTSLGFTQRHEDFVIEHSVTAMSGISSDTTYFFSVESTDANGTLAVNNNSGNFFTFKTLDITPPPQVTGLKVVSTTPDSVFLIWDIVNASDLSHYIVHRNRVPIDNTTANSFTDIGLSQNAEFTYKVSAVDISGNEGQLSDAVIASTLVLDLTLPVISNVDVLALTDATAKITWLTDENSTTIVLYGINNTDKTKSSFELVTNHTIVIDGLVKNVKHTFTVKSCDKADNCANSLNHSFTGGKDITLPFINLSIPKCSNRRVIDVIGTTEPFTKVMLFVNDMTIPKRILSGNEIGSSGKFIFSQIQLEQSNVIKIVMDDKSGNKNEKIFEVKLDIQDPVVQLNEIHSITSKSNVSISGTVSEFVIVKIFVDANVNESSEPSQITGLNSTKIGQNSVELKWDESKDKDFSHYVVHRSDIGAIAITKPSNFNLFIDALVDSGKTYTYQVSAVNIFAKEGHKSEAITVTTLKGGGVLNLNPPLVDIFEDFRKPLLVANATNNFDLGVKLARGDGTYKIKAIFEDCAENNVIIQKNIKFDTKKPEIKIISPPTGAFIFENVANQVDVIGKTEPNARVHLFVDRTPFSSYDYSIEVATGLPNDILPTQSQLTPQARLEVDIRDLPIRLANISISEDKLDAKCRSAVSAASCRTGADRSVTADSEGNFKFDNVDLTVLFGGAGRIRQVSPTDFRDTQLNQEVKESKTTKLILIATDEAGQRGVATQSIRIGTCWSGNQSWDLIPLIEFQTPALLSTERLAEGTEAPTFIFNYSYIGAGTRPIITGISMQKACSDRALLDPRFNISCQIMPAGVRITPLNKEKTATYNVMQLGRLPNMDKFLEDDWKSFFNAINKELTFPLKVRITYKHDVDNDGDLETETQTTCQEVSYVVDDTLINFKHLFPDWMLYDLVDWLQEGVKTLTKVQEQLNKLVDYVAIGCLSSFGLNYALIFYRRWVTFWEEKKFFIKDTTKFDQVLSAFKLPQEQQGNEADCTKLISGINKAKNGFKLKYVNDIDLKRCFPTVASAWETEAKVYQGLRFSCDRIFGHTAPSAWTENVKDEDLLAKIQSIEGCPNDQSARGQPLRVEQCIEFARKNPKYSRAIENQFGTRATDLKCTLVKGERNQEAVYTIGEQVPASENLYTLSLVSGLGADNIYAVKSPKSDDYYLTAQSKTCQEICDGGRRGKKTTVTRGNDKIEVVKDASGSGAIGDCMPVQDCRKLNAQDDKAKEYFVISTDNEGKGEKKESKGKIKYARTWGYTRDCFYDRDNNEQNNPDFVSDDLSKRQECCCIGFTDEKTLPTRYYQPDDYDPLYEQGRRPVHQSIDDSTTTIGLGQEPDRLLQNEFNKMKFSYRYYKEGFTAKGTDGADHTKYHPNRYIEGRDFPACFGANNLLLQAFNEQEKVLMVDPFKQHTAALQCVHLTGISNRLQFLKNLMSSMSTCLIQIRTTGRGDAGACKELFTQHVCGAIWQAVSFIVDRGCAKDEFDGKSDPNEDRITDYVKAGFKGVYESISDIQNEISQEYGNAKLNEFIGIGEESVARKICLAAFGYDWEFNVKNLVDAAYTTPFATLVQAITKSREFLAVEPLALRPKYEYRASWIINPGCDFDRYDVYLACVGRKQLDQYSNQINCPAVGAPSIAYAIPAGRTPSVANCDCIQLPDEKIRLVFNGRLKQNILEDKALHQVIEDNFRYDHLKFVLKTDRRIPANIRPNCFPTGYDDGVFYFPISEKNPRDLFGCRLDHASGSWICGEGSTFASKKGTAEFVDITINGVDALRASGLDSSVESGGLVFSAGDTLKVDTTVRSVGQDKCLKVTFEGISQAEEDVFEGIHPYSFDVGQLALGVRSLVEVLPQRVVSATSVSAGNLRDVEFNIKFFSKDSDLNFNEEEDSLTIDGVEISLGELKSKRQVKIKEDGIDRVTIEVKDDIATLEREKIINRITLEKERAIVEISLNSIQPQLTPFGQPIAPQGIPLVSATIIAHPLQQSPLQTLTSIPSTQLPQSQSKTLTLGLYHTRDNPEAIGIDNCNFNDHVIAPGGKPQERTFRIRVESKPISRTRSQQAPIAIGSSTISPSGPIKAEQTVSISIPITPTTAEVESLQLDCNKPDGLVLPLVATTLSGNNYKLRIPKEQLQLAGIYTCIPKAKSRNYGIVEGKPFSFEVQCGGVNNEYGLCDSSGACCKERDCKKGIVSGGLTCPTTI